MKVFGQDGTERFSVNRFDTGPFDKQRFLRLLEEPRSDHRPVVATAMILVVIAILFIVR